MKKILFVLICCLLLINFTGCDKKEKPATDEKEKNPVVKINLNDELYVYQIEQNMACSGYFYPTNLSAVKKDSKPILITELGSLIDSLEFDSNKEDKVYKNLTKLEIPKYGMRDFDFSFDNHVFMYTYYNIRLYGKDNKEIDKENKYYGVALKINNNVEEFKNKLKNIFVDANLHNVLGSCPGDDINMERLNEDICEKYNLDCGRW